MPLGIVQLTHHEIRDGLNSFAQAHLVGEYAVALIVVAEGQPVEALQLIAANVIAVLIRWRLGKRAPLIGSGTLEYLSEHKYNTCTVLHVTEWKQQRKNNTSKYLLDHHFLNHTCQKNCNHEQ